MFFFPPDVHGAFHHLLTVVSRWGGGKYNLSSVHPSRRPAWTSARLVGRIENQSGKTAAFFAERAHRKGVYGGRGGSRMMFISSAANKEEIQRLCTQRIVGVAR